MEIHQTSDADKTGKMLDPSDNSPERSTIPIDPDNNKEIGDLSTGVQDVPVSTGESNKGDEDPGTSNNMSLFAGILKNFFSSNLHKFQVNESSIPGQSDQPEEKIKRDLSISFPLGSDHEKLDYFPGVGTSFPRKTRFLDDLHDKTSLSEEPSKFVELIMDILNQMETTEETSDHGPTYVIPLDIKRTGDENWCRRKDWHHSDDSNTRSPTKRKHKQGVCDSNQSISHILGSDHENLKYDPGEGTSFQRNAHFTLPYKPTHSQEKSKLGKRPTNVSPLDVVKIADSIILSRERKREQGIFDSVSSTDYETSMANLKWIARRAKSKIEACSLQRKRAVPENVACESKPSNISIPKPLGVMVSDPNYPTPNDDGYQKLPSIGERIEEFNWLVCQTRETQKLLLDVEQKRMVLQQTLGDFSERDSDMKLFGIPVNEFELASPANVSEGAVSRAVETRKGIPDNIALVKPTVLEKPEVPYPFDIKDPPAPQKNPDLSKYCKFQEAEKYPDPPSPDSLDGSGGEVDDSDECSGCSVIDYFARQKVLYKGNSSEGAALGAVVTAKEKLDNTVTSEFLKPSVQENPNVPVANPFDCTDHPVPHEVKLKDGAKEEEGVKRRGSVIVEAPKKQKLSEETFSPQGTYSNDRNNRYDLNDCTYSIPVSFSNPDVLAWIKDIMLPSTPKNVKHLEESY